VYFESMEPLFSWLGPLKKNSLYSISPSKKSRLFLCFEIFVFIL